LKIPTAPLSIGLGLGLALSLLATTIVPLPGGQAQSREPDKTLRLFFGHTGEKGEFTFKRNGAYDRSELKRLNHFLRDWRKDEDAHMDPHLLDLVWAIYQKTGSKDYIHVVSAYRSPATNEMLRRRSSGVAKNSQHRLGKAMDWYLTDVPLAKLRGIAMQMQGGGVGYYPRSGSPFVHTDTGNVRAWPRMTRQQLLALFPNGNTLHLPADGKPLPGYELALAKRKASGGATLAYLDVGASDDEDTDRTGADSSDGWLRRVFPGKSKDEAVATAAPATAPAAAAADATPAADQPEEVAAVADDENAPRTPRARPALAAETPVETSGGDIVLASVEPTALDATGAAPPPRARPIEAEVRTVSGEDAIALLTARINEESPVSTGQSSAPIDMAFVAAAESPQSSEADRAILAAFATLRSSDAVHEADPALVAALTRLSTDADPSAEELPRLRIALADTATAAEPQPTPQPAEEPQGIVLAPAEPASYGGDEPELVKLIEAPRTPEAIAASLAMPVPGSGFYAAPEEASEVADLRGRSGPPVDQFARSGEPPAAEKSFFTRLFASLVE